MAGASSTGPVNDSSSVLSRSSARPAAALASKLAVAGATHSSSALPRQVDVGPQRMLLAVEDVLGDRPAAERRERGRADELASAGRHHHRDAGAGLNQPADQRRGLVRGHAAADAHDEFTPLHRQIRLQPARGIDSVREKVESSPSTRTASTLAPARS